MPKFDDVLAFLHPLNWFRSLGRFLLGVACTVAVMIPYTQHAWSWDRFLQGGHDFETNLLLFLSLLCLILLLGRRGHQSVEAWFASLRGWRIFQATPSFAANPGFLYAELPDDDPSPGLVPPLRI